MKKQMIVSLSLLLAGSAASAAEAEIWKGAGSLFDREVHPIVDYSVRVERTPEDAEHTRTHVLVTKADGTVIHEETCRTTKSERGWTNDCDGKRGTGTCLGEGLCMSYDTDDQGHGFAATLVFDDLDAGGRPRQMRILRTELLNGEALRFYREKLVRE